MLTLSGRHPLNHCNRITKQQINLKGKKPTGLRKATKHIHWHHQPLLLVIDCWPPTTRLELNAKKATYRLPQIILWAKVCNSFKLQLPATQERIQTCNGINKAHQINKYVYISVRLAISLPLYSSCIWKWLSNFAPWIGQAYSVCSLDRWQDESKNRVVEI